MATQHSARSSHLTLGPDDEGRVLTAEEFASAEYAEPWKYERVEGRLVVMAPDGFDHQRIVEEWRDALAFYRVKHPKIVKHVFQAAWVRVDRDTDRVGDIGVYLVAEQELPDPPDRPPDLMFEFVSPGTKSRARDYVAKRKAYFRYGIREYVVVDRFARTVTVLTRGPRSYAQVTLGPSDSYASTLLPGLAIPLEKLLSCASSS